MTPPCSTGAGLTPAALACGTHEPLGRRRGQELITAGAAPTQLHHNCSGKHAAMLATAVHLAEPTEGYWRPDHPVQQRIRRALDDMTGLPLGADVLRHRRLLGAELGDAAVGDGAHVRPARDRRGHVAGARRGVPAHSRCVLGAPRPGGRARAAPTRSSCSACRGRCSSRRGAEGVYCGAFPELGLGFALKIDDGAKRAAEAAVVQVIARLHPTARQLGPDPGIANWRGLRVGEVRAADALEAMLARLA